MQHFEIKCCIIFYIMLEYTTKYEIKIYNKKTSRRETGCQEELFMTRQKKGRH